MDVRNIVLRNGLETPNARARGSALIITEAPLGLSNSKCPWPILLLKTSCDDSGGPSGPVTDSDTDR